MGDSSAAGVGADTAEQSLLGQLLAELSPNYQVHYKLLAKTGRTTQSMLNALNKQPIEDFDFVITALGVNDVTAQVSVKTWLEQQSQLVEKITQLYSPKKIIMSGLPPMGDFPALPWPLNTYIGRCANQLDVALQDFCKKHEKLTYLSFREFPNNIKTASDGFHPGPEIYALWAKKIAGKITLRVSVNSP